MTVEYRDGIVEVHFDEEGAELLADRLLRFARRGERDHDHFMTPSWAGWELSEERLNPKAELVNKLNLRFWPAKERHA